MEELTPIAIAKGVTIAVGILTLGILILPTLFALTFWEDYLQSEARAEKRRTKAEAKATGSHSRGLFTRN